MAGQRWTGGATNGLVDAVHPGAETGSMEMPKTRLQTAIEHKSEGMNQEIFVNEFNPYSHWRIIPGVEGSSDSKVAPA